MDKANDLMNALGAVAEMLGFFYGELKKQGFDDIQSMAFCTEYMKILLSNKDDPKGGMTDG